MNIYNRLSHVRKNTFKLFIIHTLYKYLTTKKQTLIKLNYRKKGIQQTGSIQASVPWSINRKGNEAYDVIIFKSIQAYKYLLN